MLFGKRFRGQEIPRVGAGFVRDTCVCNSAQQHKSTIKSRMTPTDLCGITFLLTSSTNNPFRVQTNACTRNKQQCKHPCKREKAKHHLFNSARTTIPTGATYGVEDRNCFKSELLLVRGRLDYSALYIKTVGTVLLRPVDSLDITIS